MNLGYGIGIVPLEAMMRTSTFTPENAAGFTPVELTCMNAAYARLRARRERITGVALDATEHDRLCALIRGAVTALRRGGWTPTEAAIVGEIERREPAYPPQ
ncbi:MAG: hypothetical protein JOY71_16460 [Acetobacteraceae bacterium]|nr:hypothetical protein [Acetobacteraceae bacterium]MBV8523688.1 hypothetical protein [Acetobacteraceae bacterium]MBV8591685.1 hypothetical protein [Acetobacteraceae bacterium]